MENLITNSKILQYFTKEQIKTLYHFALRVDIDDNNTKAEVISAYLGPEFDELGTGTNRIAFLHDGYVLKIALDRRGLVDNYTEMKRSQEVPEYFAKVYESNMLIIVCEYVGLMSDEDFRLNADGIRTILEDLSKNYVFGDIGYSTKNRCNWGYRDKGISGSESLVILDYGYMYKRRGNEKALRCPKCGTDLHYDKNYNYFVCGNNMCSTKYSFMDIRRRMSQDLEDAEDEMIANINNLPLPNLAKLNDTIY